MSKKKEFKTEEIRQAKKSDADAIEHLLLPYVQQEIILPRSREQLEKYLPNTWVYTSKQEIIAVASLFYFQPTLVEVRGLAVKEHSHKSGVGSKLLRFLIEHLKHSKTEKNITLFALTYAPEFFQKLGFTIVEKEKFPQKIFEVCHLCSHQDNCKEIAVELLL